MKTKHNIPFVILIVYLLLSGSLLAQQDSGHPAKHYNKRWYGKQEWLGKLSLQPHSSINKKEFTKQYTRNKTYWDEAFAFLKNNNVGEMKVGKYTIDGDHVYAMITENKTKEMDSAKWESHRNYIDLHSVLSGEEKIGVAPIEKLSVTMPYDAAKDLMNYSGSGAFYVAKPGTFFLFFPQDGHKPNITTGGNKADKKVVLKIEYAK